MTKHEAGLVFGIMNAGFPHDALEMETAALYIDHIKLLENFDVGVAAAQVIVREGDRFPTIKEFRRAYHAIAERRRAAVTKLPEPARSNEVPEWVHIWWWDRNTTPKAEWKSFPQQPPDPEAMTKAEFLKKREAWIEAGAPRVRDARELARMMAGKATKG